MLGALLTLFVIAIVGVVALAVIFALVGAVFGLVFGALALLFKALPVILVGWMVVKLLQRSGRAGGHRRLSPADQRWLDS
ncbi:MAG TPA: hypothetical protein VF263_23110 [Longimicrobiaceae bacterium]